MVAGVTAPFPRDRPLRSHQAQVAGLAATSAHFLSLHTRALLFDPPTDRDEALRRCALASEDVALVQRHRRSNNRLGFAVQLALGHAGVERGRGGSNVVDRGQSRAGPDHLGDGGGHDSWAPRG